MPALAELSLPAVDVLWDDLRLGEIPFPLEVRGHGATLDERARIKTTVYADLERRGLADAGRPAPWLENTLQLLDSHEVGVDLVAQLGAADEPPLRAVAVARGRRAALAVQLAESIVLTEVRDTAIVAAVIDLLPPSRPGRGRSVTLPISALEPGALSNGADARFVASVMQRPPLRVGQLGIMLRDNRGRRRLPGIAWFDTDHGRYAGTVTRGRDGQDWTTLSPVDNARLAQRLAGDLATARRGR